MVETEPRYETFPATEIAGNNLGNLPFIKGGVLLGLPHVMPAQSPQAYGGVLPSRNCLTGVNARLCW